MSAEVCGVDTDSAHTIASESIRNWTDPMSGTNENRGWIGASLLRKEDARHLYGRGMFIADVQVPGVQDVAFVRSQMANAWVRRVAKPADMEGRVFTLADIGPINVLRRDRSSLPIAIVLILHSLTTASDMLGRL